MTNLNFAFKNAQEQYDIGSGIRNERFCLKKIKWYYRGFCNHKKCNKLWPEKIDKQTAYITKLPDGHTIINIKEGAVITLTLKVVGSVEVWDTWEWGAG